MIKMSLLEEYKQYCNFAFKFFTITFVIDLVWTESKLIYEYLKKKND